MPGGLAAAILLTLIAGLILWLAGARVMKATFAAGGVALGGLIGFLLPALAEVDHVGSAPAPLLGLAVGGVVGLLVAVAIFRASMAMAAAGSFAVAGFVGAAAFLNFAPELLPAEWADDAPLASLVAHGQDRPGEGAADGEMAVSAWALPAGLLEPLDPTMANAVGHGWTRMLGFAGGLRSQIEGLWDELTDRERAMLAVVTLAAAAIGLCIGLSAPQRSAAVVSAMAGAAVWLVSFASLAGAVRLPGREVLAQPPMVWASIWLVVAVAGLIFQYRGLRTAAD